MGVMSCVNIFRIDVLSCLKFSARLSASLVVITLYYTHNCIINRANDGANTDTQMAIGVEFLTFIM